MPKEDRWINRETAVKLLGKVCNFLARDDSGVADFILDGKEAVIMSAYTGAFFLQDSKHVFNFRSTASSFHATELLTLVPVKSRYSSASELVPILSKPLGEYLKLFPEILGRKYLFMFDVSKYYPPSYFKATTTIYSEYYYEAIRERYVKELLEMIRRKGLKTSDCLIWPSGADGSYGEDFWCYVAGVILRDKGYFVSDYNLGGGDISAYFIPEYLTSLQNKGFISKGCFIEELELIKSETKTLKEKPDIKKYETVLVEAESSELRTKSGSEGAGIGQVEKYLSHTNYNKAFVAGPYCSEDDVKYNDRVGLISCDEEGNPILVEREPFREANSEDIRLIKEVIRCSLLKNLDVQARLQLCQSILGHRPESLSEYFDAMLNVDLDAILSLLQKEK
jgi:hypothetical protein